MKSVQRSGQIAEKGNAYKRITLLNLVCENEIRLSRFVYNKDEVIIIRNLWNKACDQYTNKEEDSAQWRLHLNRGLWQHRIKIFTFFDLRAKRGNTRIRGLSCHSRVAVRALSRVH